MATRDKRELELYLERIGHSGQYDGRDYTCSCSKPKSVTTVTPRTATTANPRTSNMIVPRSSTINSTTGSSVVPKGVVMTKSPNTILASGNRVDGGSTVRSNVTTTPVAESPDRTPTKVVAPTDNVTIPQSVLDQLTNSDQVDNILILPNTQSPFGNGQDLPNAPGMEFQDISQEELDIINDIVGEQKDFAANNPDGRKYIKGNQDVQATTSKAGGWLMGLLVVGSIVALARKKKKKTVPVIKAKKSGPKKITL